MNVLLNGFLFQHHELIVVSAKFEPDCDIHVTSCGECPIALCLEGAVEHVVRVHLEPGETFVCAHAGGLLHLSVRPKPVALTTFERRFVAGVVSTLRGHAEGARDLQAVLEGAQIPHHAATLIANDPNINMFEIGEATKCVVRKQPRPKYHRKCPRIAFDIGVGNVARRANHGEPTWKQCGASFSTIMRHVQKTPDQFRWGCDDDNRTVITHV